MYPNSLLDHGTIYVKFDDLNAGNSKKNHNLSGEQKWCELIYAQSVSMEGQVTLWYCYKKEISVVTWSCDDNS